MVQGATENCEFEHQVFEKALENGPLAVAARFEPCQPCLVLSTGGSTGLPKSILHCSETLMYAVEHFATATDFTERDVHVAMMPYGHAAGSVFEIYMPLLRGASILTLAKWQVESVASAIEAYGGTYFITMGAHGFDLLTLDEAGRAKLSSVRLVTSGAGPDALFEQGERELGFEIVRVYGCSECPGHAIGRPGDTPDTRLRHDGVPFDGMEFRIVDSVGEPVAIGEAGEYQCRGPNLFMGYARQFLGYR